MTTMTNPNEEEQSITPTCKNGTINTIFQKVTTMVQSSSPPLPLSDDIKLHLYALYKRSTTGTTSDQTNLVPPSIWNVVAYRKYHAWRECDHLTREESMTSYIELVSTIDCDIGRECQSLLDGYRNSCREKQEKLEYGDNDFIKEDKVITNLRDNTEPTIEKLINITIPKQEQKSPLDSSTTSGAKVKSESSLFTKLTGIKPFIPRGQLDISTIDILFAMFKTIPLPFNRSSIRATMQLEDQIEATWKRNHLPTVQKSSDDESLKKDDIHVITGLSVRSLLDLYLSCKSFKEGSEVIIVPPINIEGMINVLEYHGIKIKPIDIEDFGTGNPIIAVNLEKVRQAITPMTVAVMIVHPFGLVCMKENELKQLKQLLNEESSRHGDTNIELWEDCAECYTGSAVGENCYLGSSEADLQFFSFGTIKTATALGGGIAILKQNEYNNYQQQVFEQMKRLQHMSYKQQNTFDYFIKLCKVFFLHVLSLNWIILGCFLQLLDFYGINYDELVTSSVKGFPQNGIVKSGKSKSLIQRLRERPCLALLSLLHRKLLQSKRTSCTVISRIRRCQSIRNILQKRCPSLKIPEGSNISSQHLYWLFPIMVQDPESVSRYMKSRGFDVPKGTSQLGCITSYLTVVDTTSSCPNAEYLMEHILYLPIAAIDLNESDFQQLTEGLRDFMLCNHLEDPGRILDSEKTFKQMLWSKCGVHLLILSVLDRSILGLIPFSSVCYSLTCWIFRVCMQIALPTVFAILLLLHVVRSTIGRYYIHCSNSFAKYNAILNDSGRSSAQSYINDQDVTIVETNIPYQQSNEIFDSKCFQLPATLNSVEQSKNSHKFVLLTGATGFIGSLLLRDLLMYRNRLGINGVVLICRSKRKVSAAKRIENMMEKSMYSFLSEEEKRDLVIVMEGDLASPNIGISSADMQRLCKDFNITHIFNCAACVSFIEPLENAAESNITSALQLQQLIKQMKNKKALYIYFSTAFIHGNLVGTATKPLPEELFNFGQYDPAKLYSSMMTTQSYASKAMHDLGFPNTYTFSKSICEHLLMNHSDIKTLIVRPSIVGPAIEAPYEGWAGDKPSTLVAGACLYMTNPYNLWTFRSEKAPVIPVDVVSRFVISKAFLADVYQVPLKSDDEASKVSEESYRSSEISYVFTKSSSIKTYLSETDSSLCSSEECNRQNIFTVAWDCESPACTGFLWYDFACAIVQLSTVNGHVELSVAYFILLVSFRIFLAMNLTFSSFKKVHKIFVHGPFLILKRLCGLFGSNPKILNDFEKLSPFLDLPLLFFPFTTATFYFSSELCAPSSVNGERYMVSCILAAENFVKTINKKLNVKKNKCKLLSGDKESSSDYLVAGRKHARRSDLWWALTQPKGSYIIRLVGLFVAKLLRYTSTSLTVDMQSMSNVARAIEQISDDLKPCIILASTHRSYYDFLILSFISFALPELGIPIPCIAAADDFARIPLLGWLAQLAGAFFLSRGKGIPDPSLKAKIVSLKESETTESPTCIEVFLEGKRSRDRRFMAARTGFLKCLKETGGKHLVVPITINYERLPEQSNLAKETEGYFTPKMNIYSLCLWLKNAYLGKVNLGSIHVSAAQPLLLEESNNDVSKVATIVQTLQMEKVCVSQYHIMISAQVLGLDKMTITRSLQCLGCQIKINNASFIEDETMSSLSEGWTVLLQFGHLFSPFILKSHPKWAAWLNPLHLSIQNANCTNEDVKVVVGSLIDHFEATETVIKQTVKILSGKGFINPSHNHIVQYTCHWSSGIPILLIKAGVTMYLTSIASKKENTSTSASFSGNCPLFRDTTEKFNSNKSMSFKETESFGAWGFKDSKFIITVESDGTKNVTMSGNRYSISGRPMPNLLSFLERETEVKVDIMKTTLSCIPPRISTSDIDITQSDIELLLCEFNNESHRISTTVIDRVRHGTGHSQEDMYNIRNGGFINMRIPDVVVFPQNEKEVSSLISLAVIRGWCLIPFGGGTNVSHATWCPPKDIEPRPILSVDMRMMNKIIKINKEDSTIHVEAGITGGELMNKLHELGFTIGHEPDSIEFSTVGGWIATNSSGMKQNKYGNIENIVKGVRVANSNGLMWQHNEGEGASFGRVATGTNLTSLVLGSEGSLGIITSAVLKIWPLPEKKEFESIILHNFDDGIRFVKDVAELGALKPASIRLLDNTQFRLGQAMKSKCSFIGALKKILLNKYANIVAGEFLSHDVVCVTVTFEGSHAEVKLQQKLISDIASKHGGICAGSEIGKAGYDMTYAIAYLRDFAMTYGFLAESFETFVPWSKVTNLIASTKDCLKREHLNRALPGLPIVSCRITQLYDEGVCVYFYFCMNFENVSNASEIFSEIELSARKIILVAGGSLSHHHGIGKARAALMHNVNPENVKNVFMNLKKAFDPENVFGARNGCYA